jgi:hypothetical protein
MASAPYGIQMRRRRDKGRWQKLERRSKKLLVQR